MSHKFIYGLVLAAGLAIGVVGSGGSASASGWSVTIEHNPMSTACGSVTNIPVAGANSCPTATTAAVTLFNTLLGIPGCLNVCPVGEAPQLPLPTPTCTPNGAPPRNWQVGVNFTCVKIGQRTIDLGIKKSGGGTVPVGGAVDFTLNTFNYGPSTVGSGINAVVTDTLPPGVTSVTVTAPGWHCTVIALSVVCIYNGPTPIGANQALPPITIHSTATTVGTYNNCANIHPVGTVDTNDENNRACAPFTVTDPPPPSIKGCLEDSKVAVTCNPDGTYTVTLSGGSFTGNTITMTSQTAGVTVTPPQQPWAATTSWIITGATAGQTVVLNANATKTGGGSEPGTDQCCSGQITIVMPECLKGTVVVEKKVKNDTEASIAVINALNFQIKLMCPPSPINTTFILNNGGIHTENNVPYGSVCTVTETGLPPPPSKVCPRGSSAVWLTPVVTPTSAMINAPVTAFTVVNELKCEPIDKNTGTVVVEKKVKNNTRASTAAINALVFPIGLTCGSPSNLSTSFNLHDGEPHSENNIPYTSLCNVTESMSTLPPVPADACPQGSTATWATPVVTPPSPGVNISTPITAFMVVNELNCTDKTSVIDVKIEKTGGTTPFCPAPYYDFKITVTNAGNGWPATGNIVVSDTVPANMTFAPIVSPPWSCLPAGTLAAGTPFTCTYNGPAPTANQVLPPITINPTPTVGPPFPPFTNCASVAINGSSGYVDSNSSNNNSCVTVSKPSSCTCLPGQVMNVDGICACQNGQVLVGGACVPPPPTCTAPQVPNVDGICVCPLPMTPGAVPGQCICAQPNVMVGGACVPPPPPTCTAPQVPNVDGICGCPAPMLPGAVLGQCICPQGTALVDGKCITPPPVRKEPEKKKKREQACPEGTVKQGAKCVKREGNGPRVTPGDVINGIGIIRGIGGGGGGGGGGPRGGGGSPGKP